MKDGGLGYRWGALYGPAEIYDAAKGQMRMETAGSGEIVAFTFAGGGRAQSLELQGVKFMRVK